MKKRNRLLAKSTRKTPLVMKQDGEVLWQTKGENIKLWLPTAGQLLDQGFPERRYLLRPWLRQEETALLYADTGIGKSLFALSAAVSIAGEGCFLGWETAPSSRSDGWRVAYVDGEMHPQDIQERLRGVLCGADLKHPDRVASNLRLFPRQGQKATHRFPLITHQDGIGFYRALVDEWTPDLLILDNFSTLAEVDDENDASAFDPLVTSLLSLKQKGLAVLLVHHSRKDGETYRGSTKLAATFEVIVKLDRSKTSDPASEGTESRESAEFITCFEKVRSGKRPMPCFARLVNTPRFSQCDALEWEWETPKSPRLQEIVDGLREERWSTRGEIADYFGVDASTITRDLQKGERFGLWTRTQVDSWLRAAKSELEPEGQMSKF